MDVMRSDVHKANFGYCFVNSLCLASIIINHVICYSFSVFYVVGRLCVFKIRGNNVKLGLE